MGDVALAVPVLQAAAREYPQEQWVLLTRKPFQPFFAGIPNLHFFEPDLYGRHKGLSGLFRLFRELNTQYRPQSVIDLHHVMRTMIVRTFFRLTGVPVAVIDKGRSEKKRLVSSKNRQLVPLRHSTQRYAEVFAKAGFPLKTLAAFQPIGMHFSFTARLRELLGEKDQLWIGIAPFAKHDQKRYPLEKMKQVIGALQALPVAIFLFGGGKEELLAGEKLLDQMPNARSVIGQLTMHEELALMSVCDLMLTMDSGNMHLARLVGTPVISIWGATHPFAGFAPFLQEAFPERQLQTPLDLPCRPCSVFGNKPCSRHDLACLHSITPQMVVGQIKKVIGE